MFVTRTVTGNSPSVGTVAGTSRSVCANVVYDSPCPNGATGVAGRLVTSLPSPNVGCRYEYGCAPAEPGRLTGSRPDGLTRPESTPVIAAAPSSPGKNACTTAAHRANAQPSAYGRPVSSTSTTGVPVARTASTSSRCTPGSSRSSRSQPSPTVPRPKRPAWSPTTRTATSAADAVATASAKPDRSSPSTSQPPAQVTWSAPNSARIASRTVGTSMPVSTPGCCTSTWLRKE